MGQYSYIKDSGELRPCRVSQLQILGCIHSFMSTVTRHENVLSWESWQYSSSGGRALMHPHVSSVMLSHDPCRRHLSHGQRYGSSHVHWNPAPNGEQTEDRKTQTMFRKTRSKLYTLWMTVNICDRKVGSVFPGICHFAFLQFRGN